MALARLARWLGARAGAKRKIREIQVVFNGRLRTALGRADFRAVTIELNARLLDRHPAELVPTLAHELGHLVAGARAAHGPRWRQVMGALGFSAEVCHRLDVSEFVSLRRRWTWRCVGCGESYRRARRDVHRFRCGRCGRKLRLLEPAQAPAPAGN